jgi:glucose-1-phosphate cytidylyltransferase
MIEVAGAPILWHIMKYYSHFGFDEFIICCGYKSYVIKQYFADYFLHRSDITFDFSKNNKITVHSNLAEPWRVSVIDTGLHTQTGGRIKRIQEYIGEETFLLTYGDGVSDIHLPSLIKKHQSSNNIATLSATQPVGRFGVLHIDGDNENVSVFREKAKEDTGWINAGFMIMEPDIFSYIDDDNSILEREPLEKLSSEGKLGVHKHKGFWKCMDTQRDKFMLESLWEEGNALWKIWDD